MFPIILGFEPDDEDIRYNALLCVNCPQGYYSIILEDNKLYENLKIFEDETFEWGFIESEKLKKLVIDCSRGYFKQTLTDPAVSFAKEILEVVTWYEENYLKSAEVVSLSDLRGVWKTPMSDKDEETLFLLCNMRLALDEYYNSFLDFTKDKKEKHEGSRLALLRSLETMVKLTLEKIHGTENDAQNS